METLDLDALVVRSDSSKWDSGSAAARYLTQIGGNGEEGYAVFARREEPTFIIWGPGHIENWRAAQDWTRDIRPSDPSSAAAIAARLRELGADRRRIGVVGKIGTSQLARDGQWPDSAWRELVAELPDATFVDFDAELASVRSIKSAEELACIERSMLATEAAIDALHEHAREGEQASVVYGRMVEALIAAGSEMCVSVLLSAAARGRLAARLAPERRLAAGDVIRTEISGKYAGYWSQAHVPVAVGEPAPIVRTLFAVMLEGFERGLAQARPGASSEDLVREIRRPAERAAYSIDMMPAFKGIGLAVSELPEGGGLAASLAQDMVLTLQPTAYDPVSGIGLHMSETVHIGAAGARRLGRRSLALQVVSP